MSAGPYDQTGPATTPGTQEASTTDVAKEEAASVAQDAKEGTRQVAETAKNEAQHVAGETQQQIKDLYRQLRSEITSQSSDQQKRASGGLRTLAEDLDGMAQHSDSGIGGDLAQQLSGRTREIADWLENREPGDVLDEVKRYARQRPGAFLAGAAVLGLVAGRLTRGVVAEKQDESAQASPQGQVPHARAVGTDAAGQPLAPAPGTGALPGAGTMPATAAVPPQPATQPHGTPGTVPTTGTPGAVPPPGGPGTPPAHPTTGGELSS